MNLLLFSSSELQDSILSLKDYRARHILRVLRLQVGDTLRIGMIDGPLGTGTISLIAGGNIELQVELQDGIPPRPKIDLILALPRPIMLRRILKHAAVLGVDNLFLINSRRVEKSFFNASILQPDKIRSLLIEGLEQAMDTRLPLVSVHTRFKPFLEDRVPAIIAPVKLIAHPDINQSLPQCFPEKYHKEKVLLAIGPEGGWIDYEIDHFRQQGFQPFSMGLRILHVDTAVIALTSQIQLLQEERKQAE